MFNNHICFPLNFVFLKCFSFGLNFSLQFFLGGDIEHILRGKYLAVVLGERIFDDGVALVRTEDDADGRVVALVHLLAGVVVDVHLHLPDVLMGEIARFEVDKDKAFQNIVIEHEIDVKVPPVEVDVLLPCNEGEAAPEFQEEFLQVVDERLFEVGFVETRALLHAQKFKNIGIADDIFG